MSEKEVRPTGRLPPRPGNEVDAFLETLHHPRRDDIVRVRDVILSAASGITEEIKWNAPSFRTTDHFCTFHLHSSEAVEFILHRGAKKKAPKQMKLTAKAESLVKWLDVDRAMVSIAPARITSSRAAMTALIREWVNQL